MGWLRSSKPDPISERAQALNAEIAALEAQIKDLGSRLESPESQNVSEGEEAPRAPGAPVGAEPVFESLSGVGQPGRQEPGGDPARFNDLGVRKYDLAGAWQRLQRHFRGPAASNPRLIHYLAAGSIQGLRPLRYEARVARNRVIALALLLLFVLWGLIALLRSH